MSALQDARIDIAASLRTAIPRVPVHANDLDRWPQEGAVVVGVTNVRHNSLGTEITAQIDARLAIQRPSEADAAATTLADQMLAGARQVDTDRALHLADPYDVDLAIDQEEEVDGRRWVVVSAVANYLVGDLTAPHQPAAEGSQRAAVEALLAAQSFPTSQSLGDQNRHPAITVRDDSLVSGDLRRGTVMVTVAVAPGHDPLPLAGDIYRVLYQSDVCLPTDGSLASLTPPRGALAAGELVVFSCDLLTLAEIND